MDRRWQLALDALTAVEIWLDEQVAAPVNPAAQATLAAAHQARARDTTTTADGQPVPRQGVSPDRRISLEDAAIGHGRASRGQLTDGFKPHKTA